MLGTQNRKLCGTCSLGFGQEISTLLVLRALSYGFLPGGNTGPRKGPAPVSTSSGHVIDWCKSPATRHGAGWPTAFCRSGLVMMCVLTVRTQGSHATTASQAGLPCVAIGSHLLSVSEGQVTTYPRPCILEIGMLSHFHQQTTHTATQPLSYPRYLPPVQVAAQPL